jgi:hypothetical protein
MNTPFVAAFWHALTTATSRRTTVAGIGVGLLAAVQFTLGDNDATARKRRKRRKKRKNQKPTTRIDASCAGPANISFKRDSGTARFAQTFTAIASGLLVRAELDLGNDPGSDGDYVLRLSPVNGEGVPTNDVLAETVVANADLPTSFSTVPFTFADPISVEAG